MKLRKSEFRRYLLAEPFSEGHETVEAWLGEVDDQTIEQLLGETEDNLIDEYVWDELLDEEIPGFESNFLSNDKRRQKLSFSLSVGRALKDYAEDYAAQGSQKKERPLRDFLSFRPRLPAFVAHPAWGLAMAATLASIMVGGAWMFASKQQVESQLAQVSSERAALMEREATAQQLLSENQARGDEIAAELQTERTLRTVLQDELESLRAATQTGPAMVADALTSIASIWLSPGLMRGGGQMERVILPSDARLVELLLDLGVDDYASYRAALHDAEGDETWSQAKLDAKKLRDRVAVAVTLPTTLLPQGDYSIRLSGATASGDLELAGRYYFRVLRN